MRHVAEIKAGYDWMISMHGSAYGVALNANDQARQDQLDKFRDHLERGVFVLLFAQFEVALNENFDRLRAVRQGSPDWKARRGWDTPEMRRKKPVFETRLAMMLDRKGPDYPEVIAAYGIRNGCAHGRTTTAVGSIDQLVHDLYRWSASL